MASRPLCEGPSRSLSAVSSFAALVPLPTSLPWTVYSQGQVSMRFASGRSIE
ncbi:hypothetical protein DPMN_119235 [Dreissena polymorpha]|uniref:Uncharacterized protein n=1 Tax=Dreissena polymorpha TaxID=45954 RepID=A0A9D4GM36_DREPO|nr:hypothetical protein DPMN_119235 [Dreissena polymorpha]